MAVVWDFTKYHALTGVDRYATMIWRWVCVGSYYFVVRMIVPVAEVWVREEA